MIIKKIKLQNFRNYKEQEIKLFKDVNIFYGNNAQGKTNILEALYLCAFGRSFRTYKDAELINFESSSGKVFVEFDKNNREQNIDITLNKKEKKIVKVNGIKINKNSELLGNVNMVLFSPDDTVILKEAPSSRRKFLDILISQLRPNYAHLLSEYNKVLEQRNSMLKYKNIDTIDIWNEQLANYAERIYSYRKCYIDKLKVKIEVIVPNLTNGKETLEMRYKTQFKDKPSYMKLLEQSIKIDLIKGYTGTGIHRDDFELLVNGKELNLYGSQGQHRTAILGLKFAEMEIIKEEENEKPILLLDDITSELDLERINLILSKVDGYQVIVTCTDANIIRNLEGLTNEVKLYKIVGGNVE